VFDFGFETRNKTILSLINRLINEALLVADHGRFNRMLLQLIDVLHWFMINVLLRVGVSRRWCTGVVFMQQSEWCILL